MPHPLSAGGCQPWQFPGTLLRSPIPLDPTPGERAEKTHSHWLRSLWAPGPPEGGRFSGECRTSAGALGQRITWGSSFPSILLLLPDHPLSARPCSPLPPSPFAPPPPTLSCALTVAHLNQCSRQHPGCPSSNLSSF